MLLMGREKYISNKKNYLFGIILIFLLILPFVSATEMINYAEPLELISGGSKIVEFKVNNYGDDNVEFSASINCDKGATGFVPNFQIGTNEEKIVSVELMPSNPDKEDLLGNCQFKVTDISSGSFDTFDFKINVKYESGLICSANTLSCDSDIQNLLKCNSQGNDKTLFKTCVEGCEITSQGAKCVEDSNVKENNIFYWIIGGIILFIVLAGIIYKKLD